MTKPICEVKRCLLDDREEDISQYIEDEILALIQRLELKNPDVHLGCLQMMVKRHLEYQSTKILVDLTDKYNHAKRELSISQ
jgi:predicted amino acid-binding ACT domain protein